MRALCIITLWIFGACSTEQPELDYAARDNDYVPPTISDLDTTQNTCIINTVRNLYGSMCKPYDVKYVYYDDLPPSCKFDKVVGCSDVAPRTANIMVVVEGYHLPGRVYNYNKVLETMVHELTHLQLYCATGDIDAKHIRLVWRDAINARLTDANSAVTMAGCYNR